MDFGGAFRELKSESESLAARTALLVSEYEAACEFTSKFLDICKSHDISEVAIAARDKSVQASMDWPFGCSNSIFAMGKDKRGWPKIWGAVEEADISGGCGNSNQHQADTSNLIDGVYHFKDGKWIKVS